MKILQRGILLSFFLLFWLVNGFASHLVGGDIIYKCLGGNRYELTFVLYQDCLDGSEAIPSDNPLQYAIYKGKGVSYFFGGSIPLNTSQIIPNDFANECITNSPTLCLQRQTFTTVITLPGDTAGYSIYYQRCCRNNAVRNVINPGEVGVTFSVFIPPFKDSVCANNSAVFKNFPPQVICANYPFIYDFSATDSDADSLTYELCEAYPGGGPTGNTSAPRGPDIIPPTNPVNYRPPYSAQYPLPGNPGLAINRQTGMMTGTPTTQGRYIVTVCATEWRNGVAVNMISRDVQFLVYDCTKSVFADMPSWNGNAEIYKVVCDGYTVNFENTSVGGFAYKWYFGDGNTSTSITPTHTYADTGVYVVSLVINPGSTCEDSISKLVKVYPYLKANFSFDGVFCPEEVISFSDSSAWSYGDVKTWRWDFNTNDTSFEQNPKFVFPRPGGPQKVTLTVTNDIGCVATTNIDVPIDYINTKTGNDTIIVIGYPFALNATGADIYQWTPSAYLSDPNIANPAVVFPDTGHYTYVVRGTSQNTGCELYDTIKIQVVQNPHMFMPNAFSPNGDGLNDVLRPTIVGFALINTFEVYNRYGELVYKSANNNAPGWDGTFKGRPADVGVYFWNIQATNPITNKREQYKGDVTLLR